MEMKKFFVLPFILVFAAAVVSCEIQGNEDDNHLFFDTAVNLSSEGTANCYLISSSGEYMFDATVMGNGAVTDLLSAPQGLEPVSASLVWQTSPGMIQVLGIEEGHIGFMASGECGNALIAALDASGKIIWSWHIWFPEETPSSSETKTGYTLMNMNLGAMASGWTNSLNVKPYGLLYQWGRKDPFPASPILLGDTETVGAPLYDEAGKRVSITHSSWEELTSNNIAYSIAHPTECISNYAQYSSCRDWLARRYSNDALWGNPNGSERDENNEYVNKGSKSFYDPCPVGWRVPPADVFRTFTTSGGYSVDIDTFDLGDMNGDGLWDTMDFNYGWMFNMKNGMQFFPAAGRYDGSYAMLMGSVSGLWGAYWSNSPYSSSSIDGMAFCALSFNVYSVSPAAGAGRADAFSVRCVRE